MSTPLYTDAWYERWGRANLPAHEVEDNTFDQFLAHQTEWYNHHEAVARIAWAAWCLQLAEDYRLEVEASKGAAPLELSLQAIKRDHGQWWTDLLRVVIRAGGGPLSAPTHVSNAALPEFWSGVRARLDGSGWTLGEAVYRDGGRTRDIVREGAACAPPRQQESDPSSG